MSNEAQGSTKIPSGAGRVSLVSGAVEASTDIRHACNGIKRMTSLSVAAMVTGWEPAAVVNEATNMSMDVLKGMGFDLADEARVERVLPMVLEACALVLSEAAKTAATVGIINGGLKEAAQRGVAALSEVAKSRAVAKMVEASYPTDLDAVVALRVTTASAMAHVAVEVAQFDFLHRSSDCLKEASKTVVKAAVEAAKQMAPSAASTSARLMLTQSLIQAAARIYAATWRCVALDESAHLDSMSIQERDASLDAIEAAPLGELLKPVNEAFAESFGAIAGNAMALFPAEADSPAPTTAAAAPRKAATPRPR